MTNSNPITSCPFQRRLDAGGPHDWTRAGPSPHIARFGLAVRARPTDPRTYRKSFEKSKVHQVPARRPPRGLRAFPRRYRHVLRHFHLSGQRPTRRRGRSQHRRGNRCKHTAVRRRHESHARATRCRLRPGLREPGMRGVDRVGGSSPPSLLERRGRGCRRSADLLDDPERPEETLRRGPTLVRDGADGAGVHDRHAGARPTHRPLDHDFRLPSVRSGRLVRGGGGRLRGARQIPDARLRRDASRGCRDYALAPGRHGDREIQRPRRLGLGGRSPLPRWTPMRTLAESASIGPPVPRASTGSGDSAMSRTPRGGSSRVFRPSRFTGPCAPRWLGKQRSS